LFPLGIVYMTYGVVRAILLGFFAGPAEDEEAEIAGPIVIDESGRTYRGGGGGGGGRGALEPHERLHGRNPGDAAGRVARSAGTGGAACAPLARLRRRRQRARRKAPRAAGAGRHARGGGSQSADHVRSPAGQSGDRGLRMQRVAVVVFPGSNCDADTLD